MNTSIKEKIVGALTSRPLSTLGNMLFGSGTPIFMLHRMQVGKHPYKGISPLHLRKCLTYLTENDYRFISLDEIIDYLIDGKQPPKKTVAFTIDDGYWDQAKIAAPIFIEHKCPATIFVITKMLDGDFWPWDAKVAYILEATQIGTFQFEIDNVTISIHSRTDQDRAIARDIIRNKIKSLDATLADSIVNQLADTARVTIPNNAPDYFKAMTWDSARELENGGIRISPHTATHQILSKLGDDASEAEINKSWQRLKEELQSPSPVFCYPTGRQCDYGVRDVGFVIKTGIKGAVSTSPGRVQFNNKAFSYRYNLPRYALPDNITDFKQYCTWIENMKNSVRTLR